MEHCSVALDRKRIPIAPHDHRPQTRLCFALFKFDIGIFADTKPKRTIPTFVWRNIQFRGVKAASRFDNGLRPGSLESASSVSSRPS